MEVKSAEHDSCWFAEQQHVKLNRRPIRMGKPTVSMQCFVVSVNIHVHSCSLQCGTKVDVQTSWTMQPSTNANRQ